MKARCEFSSDASLMIRFATQATDRAHHLVWHVIELIHQANLPTLNLHPAYESISIDFDPVSVDPYGLMSAITSLLKPTLSTSLPKNARRTIEIPVHYGGIDGPDLEFVAQSLGMSIADVVKFHSQSECEVAFLGFAPGFPYLLGLDPRLQVARKATPRLSVPKGSVAIAGLQTGIYPNASPGGWQIIGRTHLNLFDPSRSPEALLLPGDRIRFVPTESLGKCERSSAVDLHPTGKPAIEVTSGGFFSTVQDLGRTGATQIGVSPGGAADRVSLTLANRLVGNRQGSAAIEMTAIGGSFRFLKETWIAVAGGTCRLTLDGHPLSMWTSYPVKRGQVLFTGTIESGLRSYLAVAGGIDVPTLVRSRSTFVSDGWGGYAGRELRSGDRLAVGAHPVGGYRRVRASVRDLFDDADIVIRAIAGPQMDWFDDADAFFSQSFEVTSDVNRRGLRLSGKKLQWNRQRKDQELITEGVAAGSIQIPSGGQPLVLFCEQQTTGGYPKIATVIQADLFKLGQLRPGKRITFQRTTLEEAWRLARERDFQIRNAVQPF